jgi:hypothetical protein
VAASVGVGSIAVALGVSVTVASGGRLVGKAGLLLGTGVSAVVVGPPAGVAGSAVATSVATGVTVGLTLGV